MADKKELLKEIETGKPSLHHAETVDKSGPRIPTATTPADVRHAMEELEKTGGKHLKHVENVSDRSAPVIEEGVQIKTGDTTRKDLLKEIEKPHELQKPAEGSDRSAPLIDPNVHVKKIDREGLLKDIKGSHDLTKVETDDKSVPRLPSANSATDIRHAMEELEKTGAKGLKHVDTNDKSAPKIDPNVQIKHNNRDELLTDIQADHTLKHVDGTKDRSAPLIDPSVQVKHIDRDGLLTDIAADHTLKHVETKDKSVPKLPSANSQQDIQKTLEELEKTGAKNLKHVEGTSDRSAPVIEEGVQVKKFDKQPLLNEIGQSHNLKHVESADKSGPVIDPNVQIKKGVHEALLTEVKAATKENK